MKAGVITLGREGFLAILQQDRKQAVPLLPCQAVFLRILPTCLIMASALIMTPIAFSETREEPGADAGNRTTFGFESDFSSRYIWHGLAFSSGPVLQNSAWISKANLTASVWSNLDLDTATEVSRLNELDLSLAYETSLHKLGIQASLQTYLYPDQPESPSTAEISLTLSYGTPVLQPFMIHTFDIKEYGGAYFGELGLRSSWEFNDKVSAEAMIETGYGSGKFYRAYVGEFKSAFQHICFEATATWNISNSLYVRPHFATATIFNNAIKRAVEKPTLVQIGIALGGDF